MDTNEPKRSTALILAQEKYEQKTDKMNIRLQRWQKEKLEYLAQKAGLTKTALIKWWIDQEQLPPKK